MALHHLQVTKTARYLTLGELTPQTPTVWIVLHGYGQNIHSFARNFESLAEAGGFILAPEGLSRFYWNGFGGKPVASWMTSEDRDNEIIDYLAYLEKLYNTYAVYPPFIQARKVLLGFSQGTATATRFITRSPCPFDHLVLWAGPLAHDINWEDAGTTLSHTKNYLLLGDQDPFIQHSDLEKQQEFLLSTGIPIEFIRYAGGHEIQPTALLDLYHKIRAQE